MKNLAVIFISVIVLCACASPPLFIKAERDPEYFPRKTDPIYVQIPDDESIEIRKLNYSLKNILIEKGFNIVDDVYDSKYLIIGLITSDSKTFESSISLPSIETTTGTIGTTTYTGYTTKYKTMRYPKTITAQRVFIGVSSTSRLINDGDTRIAWYGYGGIEKRKYRRDPEGVIETLLEHFGEDFEGREWVH